MKFTLKLALCTAFLLSFMTSVIAEQETPEAPLDDKYTFSPSKETPDFVLDSPGILKNDALKFKSQQLTVIRVTRPEHGILRARANGGFIYTPNADFEGEDRFSYTVRDGKGNTSTATVIIGVDRTAGYVAKNEQAATTGTTAPTGSGTPGRLGGLSNKQIGYGAALLGGLLLLGGGGGGGGGGGTPATTTGTGG